MDFDDLNNSLELTQIAAKTVDVKIINQQELYISVLAIYKLGGLGTSHERNLPHQCTNWRIGYLLRLDLLATKAKLPIKQIATKAASAEAKQFLEKRFFFLREKPLVWRPQSWLIYPKWEYIDHILTIYFINHILTIY